MVVDACDQPVPPAGRSDRWRLLGRSAVSVGVVELRAEYAQSRRPWVLPTIGDGSLVRYASHTADASEAPAAWGNMRIVFLQYSSDPVVFYDPASLWRAPPWMLDPPAEDMSEYFIFTLVVTQFQVALDLMLSFDAPPGYGHAYYSQDYIEPWVQVTAPDGWTVADTELLKAHCDNGFEVGCRTNLGER